MRIVVVALVLSACGRIGFDRAAAVTLDSTGGEVVAARAATTLALTTLEIGTGTDECLIAGLELGNQSATDVTLRWGTDVLTPLAIQPTAGSRGVVIVARLVAPHAGSGTLVASWAGTSDAILGAVSFAGADQVDCARATATTGTSATPEITVPSGRGHLTVGVSVTTNAFASATQSASLATAGDHPTLIQETTHGALGVTTDSCTLAAPPGPGNQLVFVGENVAGGLVSVVGANVPWQFAVRSTSYSNVEIWYGVAGAGPSTSITYTGVASSSMVCWIGELTGLASLDVTTDQHAQVGPESPGPLATTADDVIIVGYSAHAPANFGGTPTQGPWRSLAGASTTDYEQLEYLQRASAPGTWNPSLDQASSTNTQWDAVAAGFRTTTTGIGGSLGTAPPADRVTHAWTTDGTGFWAAIGVDVFP